MPPFSITSSIVGPWRDRNSWRVGARARLVVVGTRHSGVVREQRATLGATRAKRLRAGGSARTRGQASLGEVPIRIAASFRRRARSMSRFALRYVGTSTHRPSTSAVAR